MSDSIGPKSKFQERYLNSNARIMVVGGAMGPLSGETEFLTEHGWKRIADYRKGDKVAVVYLDSSNRDSTTIHLEDPIDYIKNPCKEMRVLKAPRFELKHSENHRVVYWDAASSKRPEYGYKVIPYSEVLRRHEASKNKGWMGKIRTAFSKVVGKKGIPLTEGELRLQVAVMADGSFVKRGANNYCSVCVSKERKKERLEWLCNKYQLPFKYHGFKSNDRYSNGGFHRFTVWPKFNQKRFNGVFWDASQDQLDTIADEVGHWDGHFENYQNSPTTFYYSKYKEDADFIQYAFSSQGQTSTIVKRERDDSISGETEWVVNSSKHGNGFRGFANKDGKCPITVEPTLDGYEYCFKTSTGFFLIRHKGRISVTGNSSKTYIGLMRHARFLDDPHYVGYVIRRNSTMLMSSGGVFDEAYDLFKSIDPGCVAKLRDKKIVSSAGAQIAFNHYENDKAGEDLYRGLQITNVMYDEATQAAERHIWFLLSRMRSKSAYPGSMWLTCNPDPDSYLRKWIDWYLLPEKDENGNIDPLGGRPDPEKNGIIRYMLRLPGNQIAWGETAEELIEKYQQPGKPKIRPISFQGLFGTIYDNPPLLELNPDYLSGLEAQERVERERNLHGNWNARQEAVGHFKRQWLQPEALIEPAKCDIDRTVRAWDLAGELKSELNPDPDYIACIKMSKLKNGSYFIHEVVRFRARFGDWVRRIVEFGEKDGKHVDILIPQDPNASAKMASKMIVNDIVSEGFYAKAVPTNRSKLDRYRPYAASAKNGNVAILKDCCSDEENNTYNDNSFYYKEQEVFRGDGKTHDDMVDVTSDAFVELAAKQVIPSFSLPGFTKANEFNRKIIG